MILLLDNYDSFTFNLAHLIVSVKPNVPLVIRRHDELTLDDVPALNPQCLIVSPGPGRPEDAGICVAAVRRMSHLVPILGICLGHQCIAEAFGGSLKPAERLVHGKTSTIRHLANGLFAGLPQDLEVMRYHSLAVDRLTLPTDLCVTAWTEDGEVMAVRHRNLPVFGLQFHPESFLTRDGKRILVNFLSQTHLMQGTPPTVDRVPAC